MRPSALVTGASGFIGSALTRRLQSEGTHVRGIVRSGPGAAVATDLITADLSAGPLNPAALEGIDTIYHLAAKTHDIRESADSEAEFTRINVDGTRHLLDAAPAGLRRIVFVSSVKALDEGGPEIRDELTTPHPTTAYGRSKLSAEKLVLGTAAARGFEAVCLRFPLVYGTGQKGNLTRMIAAIDRGRFPPPPDNLNRRSMLHVENAVDALMLAGRHAAAASQTYLVTDGQPYSTRQVYDWIRQALGKPPMRRSIPVWFFRMLAAAGDAARGFTGRRVGFDSDAFEKLLGSAWYSPRKIMTELGYAPRRDLKTSMPELVADYRRA